MIITRSADKERRRVTRRPSSEVMSEVRSRHDRQKVLGYKRKLISSKLSDTYHGQENVKTNGLIVYEDHKTHRSYEPEDHKKIIRLIEVMNRKIIRRS